ncbi:MAG: excinuclease ABC subunit C [Bacteroidetes bacterium 47-18]|nr:MAG: excinuclease ABC subunit C [Bacteroidetes bacterium 47-18]
MQSYFLYILTNKAKTVLYIGVTNDLKRRLYEHEQHLIVNSFSDRYNCVLLVYYEVFENISLAIEREKQLKKWSRAKKNTLIDNVNSEWKFFNDEVMNDVFSLLR